MKAPGLYSSVRRDVNQIRPVRRERRIPSDVDCHLRPTCRSAQASTASQAHDAAIAHAGWRPGRVKATHGTGSSIMRLGDPTALDSAAFCLTIAWEDGAPAYAFEGSIRATGATLTWLAALFDTEPAGLVARAGPTSDSLPSCWPSAASAPPGWDDLRHAGPVAGPRGARVDRVPGRGRGGGDGPCRGALADLLADRGPDGEPVLMQLQTDASGRRVEVARAISRRSGLRISPGSRPASGHAMRSKRSSAPATSTSRRRPRRRGTPASHVARARSPVRAGRQASGLPA